MQTKRTFNHNTSRGAGKVSGYYTLEYIKLRLEKVAVQSVVLCHAKTRASSRMYFKVSRDMCPVREIKIYFRIAHQVSHREKSLSQ